MATTPVWLAAMEALLNRGIEHSLQARALAQRLNATSLSVRIEGIAAVRASVSSGRLALIASGEPADAAIAGSPLALLHLARGTGGAVASAAAELRGDAEIANRYRELFALARPDLEEELSRVVGDLPARRLSRLAQQTLTWVRRAHLTAGQNIAEYLQEESRDLVSKPEMEEFLQGVDALREVADRVEARLDRLEQRRREPV